MNAHTIILFDKIMDQSMVRFAELPVVKSAIYTDNTSHLAEKVSYITQLYVSCFKNFGWLPKEIPFYNRVLYGNSELFTELIPKDPVLSELFECLPADGNKIPQLSDSFHCHFVILPDYYSVSGLIWVNSAKKFFVCLSECSVMRDTITIPSGRFAYLSELLEQYDSILNPSLKDWFREKEISFNKIRRDSRLYWGDTFYSHYIKMRILEALEEILFTSKTLKQIAIDKKFGKYLNLYKAFNSYAIDLSKILRFSKI